MEALATGKFCETCGSFAGADMLSGFCPSCLLNTVLETEADSTANGSQIEDYDLLNEVARGGMGIVYRARQRTPSRIVALKMILPAHLNSPGALGRFRVEAEAAAALDHESVLPIYSIGEHDGAPFYSMKFAEGGALSARLNHYRERPAEAAKLIAKLSRAVASAHEHGILHRDLKPANVLFDAADKPYVADFGLAKWVERECDLTQTLGILGTPFYMAPEQATDSRAVTAAADVYSLGAILYHLLTGHPPVSGDTPMEVLRRAVEEKPRRPRLANSRVSRDLETICLKCLEKEPSSRYATAAALADDLEHCAAGLTIDARPAGLTSRTWRWSRRNPMLAALSATTSALLMLLAVVTLRRELPKVVAPTKAVAVLPFDHPGTDQQGELLASGLQEDILLSLSKVADLKVISRNSVARYAGTQTGPGEIGRALGVDAVLTGSLRQAGSHARINVQLLRVTDGTQIWADSYDRELNDVFAIQSDLALQIASALKATVLPMEANGIRRIPTYDSQAFLLYVQANDLFADTDRPRLKLEKAEPLLQQAIERDPKFALAVALLSQVETTLADMYDPVSTRVDTARTLAEQALRLEPDLPEAHVAMGRYLWQGQEHIGEKDLAGALREFEIAQRRLPGNAVIYTLLGCVQRQLGKWNEALASLEKAAALDPNTAGSWDRLVGTNLAMRRYPAALRAIEHEIALSPNSWRCEWLRAMALRQWKGDLSGFEHLRPQTEAERDNNLDLWFNVELNLRHFDKAEEIIRNDPREMLPLGTVSAPKSLHLGILYAAKKNDLKAREYFEAALPMMERGVAESPLRADQHMELAHLYAQLHRKEDAVREGKRARELAPETKDALEGAGILTGMALIYLEVGEEDLGLRLLEHSLSVPGGAHVGHLRTSITWESFWNNPRFQQLLAKHEPRD